MNSGRSVFGARCLGWRPSSRAKEQSHLQLLVTNMAVIRQWWPSQECRPRLPLPPLPSAQTYTHKHRQGTWAKMQCTTPPSPPFFHVAATSRPVDRIPLVLSEHSIVSWTAELNREVCVFFPPGCKSAVGKGTEMLQHVSLLRRLKLQSNNRLVVSLFL